MMMQQRFVMADLEVLRRNRLRAYLKFIFTEGNVQTYCEAERKDKMCFPLYVLLFLCYNSLKIKVLAGFGKFHKK